MSYFFKEMGDHVTEANAIDLEGNEQQSMDKSFSSQLLSFITPFTAPKDEQRMNYFTHRFGGACESILLMQLLVYLNAKDLCLLSQTNKFFSNLCKSPQLWGHLYWKDFLPELQQERLSSRAQLPPLHHSGQSNTSYEQISSESNPIRQVEKSQYLARVNDVFGNINSFEKTRAEMSNEANRRYRVEVMENVIDLTQIRILPVLSVGSVFLTVILVCEQVDGHIEAPIWYCFIPLVALFVYLAASICMLNVVYRNRQNSASILKSLWRNLDSVVKDILFREGHPQQERFNTFSVTLASFCISLSIAQLILIALKLSTYSATQSMSNANWAAVLLPIWIFFALFCLMPAYQRLGGFRLQLQAHLACMLAFWVPLVIFAICLAVKLQTKSGRLSIALILVPIWVVEGIAILFSALFLIIGIVR